MIFRLGLLCLEEPGISSISHGTIPLQEFERAVIFRLGLLLSGGGRDFFYISLDNIFTGVWVGGDIPAGSAVSGGARDFFYISWYNPFTGVWAGGDIPTRSAAVWRKQGFLLYPMRQSLYRSMSGRWYSDWVCCCLAKTGISSISHETIPLQEYERAVIFRLGLLLSGGARGPGVFFIIPCVDIYEKIDMRTQTFDVPPQEVSWNVYQR